MKLIGKLVCWWKKGHKRGKFVFTEKDFSQAGDYGKSEKAMARVFACPRCGRETRYKVKPGAVG